MFIYLQMLETPEEKSKFEQIYLEYRDFMFYIANRILHNRQDSEDVVHEAFLKIIKIIGQIDDPKCPKTKNLTVIIVERAAIDLWRRRQKIQYVSMDEEAIDIGSDSRTNIWRQHIRSCQQVPYSTLFCLSTHPQPVDVDFLCQ